MTRDRYRPTCHHCGQQVGDNEYDVESGTYYSTHWPCELAAGRATAPARSSADPRSSPASPTSAA